MTTITDAATALNTGTLAAAEANAAAFCVYLTPANIVASAAAASLPLSTLISARETMGGVGGLVAGDVNFARRAQIAARLVLGT
jgi:hypothetical protein